MLKPSARALGARQSREKLLAAAMTLFGQHGFAAVSVQDICDAAGLTKGAFYHHFSSKDALYGQVYIPQLDRYLEERYVDAPDPAGRIAQLARLTLDFSGVIGRELTKESVTVMLSQNRSNLFVENRLHTRVLRTALPDDEAVMLYATFMVGLLVKWSSHDPDRDPPINWEAILDEGIGRLFGRGQNLPAQPCGCAPKPI